MGRTKQGGSVLSFIIVGVVLLGALIGGVYWYRHALVPHAAPEVATKPASPSDSSDAAKNNTTDKSSQSSGQSGSQPSDSSKSSPTPAPAQPAPAPQSSSQLPKTGPADTIATMVALGAVTAAAAAYWQSRRSLRSL